MPVSVLRQNRIATVTAGSEWPGNFEWSGDAELASSAAEMMNRNGWGWGRFLGDELFLARRVAKVLGDCEVVNLDFIVASVREDWTELLRDNLMPDPAVNSGERLDDLVAWNGLGCHIEARGQELSLAYGIAAARRWPVSGVVSVGDPRFLVFESRVGKTTQSVSYPLRRVLWERIVRIHFAYSRPTPEIVIEARVNLRNRLAERPQMNGHVRAEKQRN